VPRFAGCSLLAAWGCAGPPNNEDNISPNGFAGWPRGGGIAKYNVASSFSAFFTKLSRKRWSKAGRAPTLRTSGDANTPPRLWYVPHSLIQLSRITLFFSPCARWHVNTAICAKLIMASLVIIISSDVPTATAEAWRSLESAEVKWIMNVRAARILPF